jgi:hypothetical protein
MALVRWEPLVSARTWRDRNTFPLPIMCSGLHLSQPGLARESELSDYFSVACGTLA